MRAQFVSAAVIVLGLVAAPAPAQQNQGGPYLGTYLPDTFRILPPAPAAGSPRYEADRQMFKATRKLENTPRWALAQNDDKSSLLMKDFSCALGVELTPQNAPKFAAMVPKILRESSRITNLPKDANKRLRPFQVDSGPTCIDQTGSIKNSYDYPSGHVTYGWTVGLILAELAPDRATEILIRARAFGESRLVCGVHNMSAVEAGRSNASVLVAALHGSEAFRQDMDAARQEIAAARKAGPAPEGAACAVEAELAAKSPY
jgi:acid phosphatase (class A)